MKKVKFTIKGHVQGVGFRYYTAMKADSLGISGYAKNLMNGDVEVVAQGDDAGIEELHMHLKQGPSRSRVEKVYADEDIDEKNFTRFSTY